VSGHDRKHTKLRLTIGPYLWWCSSHFAHRQQLFSRLFRYPFEAGSTKKPLLNQKLKSHRLEYNLMFSWWQACALSNALLGSLMVKWCDFISNTAICEERQHYISSYLKRKRWCEYIWECPECKNADSKLTTLPFSSYIAKDPKRLFAQGPVLSFGGPALN
jgi:hypothetical protein